MIDTHFKSKQNQFWHLDTENLVTSSIYPLGQTPPQAKIKKTRSDKFRGKSCTF